ncbi:hypothetical protein [Streptomyces celluloflavus]|uniref:hypothetical protein n=1 Tax=Streptomyces celluloflavus TaxID=58344 RepID=UPI0036877B4C
MYVNSCNSATCSIAEITETNEAGYLQECFPAPKSADVPPGGEARLLLVGQIP